MIVLIILAIIVVSIDLVLIILWLFNYRNQQNGLTTNPFVSILIAARNEEDNLSDTLDSLLALDYPTENYEVLIGDDMSDDRTKEVGEAYAARYQQVKCHTIYKKTINGNGKANVLAQLIKKAKGEYIFITDADIKVPSTWVRSMLLGMDDKTALVTGTSVVEGKGFLAFMQKIDWLFATSMLKAVSDLNIPVTTMGNNMLMRKTVYDEVGGYEAMSFSVTEDLELFNSIKGRYKTVNLFHPDVLNISKPQNSFKDLLIQRKRWMRGAFDLPLLMILLLLIQTSFFAIILFLLILNPIFGLSVLGIKLLLRYCFISLAANKLNRSINIWGSIIFEFYNVIFSFVSLIYYLVPGKIVWKGRKY
jgi:cellulose synthase/poly-beta-1,6-N-acetylglucosamine synthase-like glycosyltransferase